MRERTLRRRRQRAIKTTSTARVRPTSTLVFAFSLLLFVGTLLLYSSVREHDFINYDDDVYIQRNAHVNDGLSWQTFAWSFTTTEQANWHPVTWLSHALDCQLFGLDAGYHHITSLLLHVLNALLLFLLLQ